MSGAVAYRVSATEVSGGAVADKLPRKPQKLSGPGVAAGRNIGGQRSHWRYGVIPIVGGGLTYPGARWALAGIWPGYDCAPWARLHTVELFTPRKGGTYTRNPHHRRKSTPYPNVNWL